MMFKPGDLVECIDAIEGQFTRGKVYVVKSVSDARLRVVEDDAGDANGWVIDKFKSAQADNGPIRTVTRREIVPGDYGRIRVRTERGVNIALLNQWNPWNAEELREAAHILNQLAEALEDKP